MLFAHDISRVVLKLWHETVILNLPKAQICVVRPKAEPERGG